MLIALLVWNVVGARNTSKTFDIFLLLDHIIVAREGRKIIINGHDHFFGNQYFSPYVSADLNKMATSFNCTVRSLEDELTQLILDGQISARIDSGKKVFNNAFNENKTRVKQLSQALANKTRLWEFSNLTYRFAGKQYQQTSKARFELSGSFTYT